MNNQEIKAALLKLPSKGGLIDLDEPNEEATHLYRELKKWDMYIRRRLMIW